MRKKYALDLKDQVVMEFLQSKGITKKELELKKFKDFAEQGLSPEIQEARFKYHNEKLQVIQLQFKGFQVKKAKPTTPSSDLQDIKLPETMSVHISNICKTPHTTKLEISQKTSPIYNSHRSFKTYLSSEERAEIIQKKIDSKIFLLKASFDKKKLKQLKNLNELEYEREKKNQKVLEKLGKNSENFLSKSSKNTENNMKKFDLVKQNLIIREKELEKNIQKSLDDIDLRHKQATKRLELDLIKKKIKAKKMLKSLNCDKSEFDGNHSEGKLQQLISKFEKLKENKKRIESTHQFKMQKKKEIEKRKKREIIKRLARHETEQNKKNLDIEKKLNKNLEKIVKVKVEKMKSLAVQNELEQLSAKTRIERINSKFKVYKNKLFQEHQNMAKRIDDFIVGKKIEKNRNGSW